jgi:hypothetical protein
MVNKESIESSPFQVGIFFRAYGQGEIKRFPVWCLFGLRTVPGNVVEKEEKKMCKRETAGARLFRSGWSSENNRSEDFI